MSTYQSSLPIPSEARDADVSATACQNVFNDAFSENIAQETDWSTSTGKRLFDISLSLTVLLLLGLPMLLIAACVRCTSNGPAFFAQKRVGRGGHLFTIYKFRSMAFSRGSRGFGLTCSGDTRVTWLGKWLRKLKLDELPQFYNILRGDMSIVGPRPKLPEYTDDLNLHYRPGITGAATIAFRHEETILASIEPDEVEAFYQKQIKPAKALIDFQYMLTATFASDARILLSTLFSSLMPHYSSPLHLEKLMMSQDYSSNAEGNTA